MQPVITLAPFWHTVMENKIYAGFIFQKCQTKFKVSKNLLFILLKLCFSGFITI